MKQPYVPKTKSIPERYRLADMPGTDNLCDPGMIVAFRTELDCQEIDSRIKDLLPDAMLDAGIRYARWAVINGVQDDEWIASMMVAVQADSFYCGLILGKPLTIFMFGDLFPEEPKR